MVDSAGAKYQAVYFSLMYWNTYTSNAVPMAYAVADANPILNATELGAPSNNTTKIDPIIANGYANAMVFLAMCLPNNLTVKSVATITIGKVNAAQVNLTPAICTGILTKAFDTVITATCSITNFKSIDLSTPLNNVSNIVPPICPTLPKGKPPIEDLDPCLSHIPSSPLRKVKVCCLSQPHI